MRSAALAPVLLAASEGADLLQRSAWRFSNEITFREAVAERGLLAGLRPTRAKSLAN